MYPVQALQRGKNTCSHVISRAYQIIRFLAAWPESSSHQPLQDNLFLLYPVVSVSIAGVRLVITLLFFCAAALDFFCIYHAFHVLASAPTPP